MAMHASNCANRAMAVVAALVALCSVAIALTSPGLASLGPVAVLALAIGVVVGLGGVLVLACRNERRRSAGYPQLSDPWTGVLAPFAAADCKDQQGLRLLQARHVFRQLRLMMAITAVNTLIMGLALFTVVDRGLLIAWLFVAVMSFLVLSLLLLLMEVSLSTKTMRQGLEHLFVGAED